MELLAPPLAETKLLQFAHAWETLTQPRQQPALTPYHPPQPQN
jgi:hypothetical protein